MVMLLAMSLVAIGCPVPVEPVEPEPIVGPVRGGHLVVAIPSSPVSIDPHRQWDWISLQSIFNLFEPLLTIDENNELRPLLAESWEASEDAMSFTFHLREGVLFHDGTPVTADALRISIERIRDPELASPQAPLFKDLERIEVVDEHTLVMHYAKPQVPAPYFITRLWTAKAISPAAIEELGHDLAKHPVGAGPFQFVEYIPDDRLVLRRFDDYWAGAPYLDELVIRIIPEAATRRIEMEAGTIDVLLAVEPKDVAGYEARGIRVVTGAAPSYQMLAVNLARSPFDELAVRRAVAYALDRETIIDVAWYGHAVLSTAYTHPASWHVHPDLTPIPYDPDRAIQILEDAGWLLGPDGVRGREGERLSILAITSVHEIRVLITEMVQAQLAAVGFEVKIEIMDWAAYLAAMRAGDYDISFWSLAGSHFEPLMHPNLHTDDHWNVSQMPHNPAVAELQFRVDDIIDEARMALERERQMELSHKFQELMLEYLFVIPLAHAKRLTAVQPWVHGLEVPTMIPVVRAERAWIDPDQH
jgi:peptide/nickel transport system substrate-binding protein